MRNAIIHSLAGLLCLAASLGIPSKGGAAMLPAQARTTSEPNQTAMPPGGGAWILGFLNPWAAEQTRLRGPEDSVTLLSVGTFAAMNGGDYGASESNTDRQRDSLAVRLSKFFGQPSANQPQNHNASTTGSGSSHASGPQQLGIFAVVNVVNASCSFQLAVKKDHIHTILSACGLFRPPRSQS